MNLENRYGERKLKKITISIHHRSLHVELPLNLDNGATIKDAIDTADSMLSETCPLRELIWHPKENRFYRMVALMASCPEKPFINLRESIEVPLPDNTRIVIVPDGGCSADYEERINN